MSPHWVTAPAWPSDAASARALQCALAARVERSDRYDGPVERVAGVDCGPAEGGAALRCAVVVLDAATLVPLDQALAVVPARFPYVPGLLSFREVPAALAAFERLRLRPHLLLCDGQGLAHPRRFGLACHLGVLLDLPSIGVAKTRLIGRHDEPAAARGSRVPLYDGEEVIGSVLRTRHGVRPLYVSIGHRTGLASAVEWVLRCAPRYRLPETTRRAHRLASG